MRERIEGGMLFVSRARDKERRPGEPNKGREGTQAFFLVQKIDSYSIEYEYVLAKHSTLVALCPTTHQELRADLAV